MRNSSSVAKYNFESIVFNISFSVALFCSYILTTPFSYNYGKPLELIVFLSSLITMVRIPIFNKVSLNQFIVYILILAVSVLVYFKTGTFIVISFSLLLIGSTNVDFRQIIKVYFLVSLFALVVVFISSKFGVIPNFDSIGKNGQVVHAFGTIYYTNFAAHVFYIALSYCLLRRFDLNYVELIILASLAYWLIFIYTVRLDGYLVLMLLVCILVKNNIFSFLEKVCAKAIMMVLTYFLIFMELILCINFKYSGFFYALDKVFSNRLSQSYTGFSSYSIKFFGQHIDMQGYGGVNYSQHAFIKYFYLDSSFVQLLLIEGLVFFIMVLILLGWNTWKFVKGKAYALSVSLLLVTISSLIDENLIFVTYNFMLLATFANIDEFKLNNYENNKKLPV